MQHSFGPPLCVCLLKLWLGEVFSEGGYEISDMPHPPSLFTIALIYISVKGGAGCSVGGSETCCEEISSRAF